MRLTLQTLKRTLISRPALLLGALVLAGCATTGGPKAQVASDTGIRIERIHPTAAGQMLDVRYRVTDRDRAQAALTRQAHLYMIDQASGARLEVPNMPKVGKLRQLPENVEQDRIYWMFFGNPGGAVKAGSRVTLVINEARIQDIMVQ